jgi:hypothetical protein
VVVQPLLVVVVGVEVVREGQGVRGTERAGGTGSAGTDDLMMEEACILAKAIRTAALSHGATGRHF